MRLSYNGRVNSLWLLVLALVGQEVAPGIRYFERQWGKDGDGPFAMQVLEVDPRHPAVNLLAVRARDHATGREKTSSLARRYGATAAVNGGYFVVDGPHAGASTGAFLWNGDVISAGANRTALLFCEEEGDREQLAFDIVDFHGSVSTAAGESISIAGVNRERPAAGLVIYRPVFGPHTLTSPDGVEVVLDAQGTVLKIEDGAGGAAIPVSGAVLSGSGPAAAWLRGNAQPGARLSITTSLQPRTPAEASGCRPTDIIGGGPRLVAHGQVAPAAEGFGHAAKRHPRTAAALTSRGTLLFVTVDGRQERSAGLTLEELARELIALGAVEAVNLDGGGSTTMVVQGEIRNFPSDGRERPVSDAILIYSVQDAASLRTLRDALAAPDAAWARRRLLREAERGVAALAAPAHR
jgi:exopolysaccharide biosynthesis protein